jgi:hypothetical protein
MPVVNAQQTLTLSLSFSGPVQGRYIWSSPNATLDTALNTTYASNQVRDTIRPWIRLMMWRLKGC